MKVKVKTKKKVVITMSKGKARWLAANLPLGRDNPETHELAHLIWNAIDYKDI